VNTSDLTVLILTFNEAPNLRRTLARLAWAKEIVIVDSFSTDETLAIAREFPQVRVVQRSFDTHAQQWNFGLDHIHTPWALALDADYLLPANFATELTGLSQADEVSAYFASFRYCIFGRPLRGTLYPPRAVLFHRDRCRFVQDGHTQQLEVTGTTALLHSRIDHDDCKPLARWIWAQDRYSALEAVKLLKTPVAELSFQDRLRRKIILAPGLVFIYTLLGKGLIFDGWPGWFYVWQRTLAEIMLSLRLLEQKMTKKNAER